MKLKIYTGEEVRAMRQKLNLNQSEFWAPFQTTQSGGSRYESSRDIPNPFQVLAEHRLRYRREGRGDLRRAAHVREPEEERQGRPRRGQVVPGTAALIVGLVVAIADGDTLTVLNEDFQQVKIRLAEIDAPEKKQPFGSRSSSRSASSAMRSAPRCG